jgi:hypothetical protein
LITLANQIGRSMTEAQQAAQARLKKLVAMDITAILLAYGVDRDQARRIGLNAADEAQQSAGMLRLVKFSSPGVKLILNKADDEFDQSVKHDEPLGDFVRHR